MMWKGQGVTAIVTIRRSDSRRKIFVCLMNVKFQVIDVVEENVL